MKNVEKLTIDKWPAIMLRDDENNVITVAHDGPGGAIVSGKDLDEASEKFVEAMKLGEAVKKLINFAESKGIDLFKDKR